MRLREIISINVRALRIRAELSQEKLAELMGVSQAVIGRIETAPGNLTADTLETIARALKVSPAQIVSNASEVVLSLDEKRDILARLAKLEEGRAEG